MALDGLVREKCESLTVPVATPTGGSTMTTTAKKATAPGANPADAVSHLAEVTTVCTACSWIVPTR